LGADVGVVLSLLDGFGIVAFAISGGIVAARKRLDIFGGAVIGAVTGLGGGTLRDLVLDIGPVFWVTSPGYLWLGVTGGVVGFLGASWIEPGHGIRHAVLVWADALGLAVFCAIGADVATNAGAHWSVAIAAGVMSAAFGGLIRDVMVNELPLVLHTDIYAMAALAGAAAYVSALALAMPSEVAAPVAAAIAFMIRGCAIVFRWSLAFDPAARR
jgi:uncharacterized membrane protein YeiH